MKKSFKSFGIKSLAAILSVLMILTTLPLAVFADAFSELAEYADTSMVADSEQNKTETGTNAEDSENIFEVTELREESVKHFRLDDGTYVASQYGKPVHYLDESGKWQDIDNTLYENGADISTFDAKIKFAKKITGNETLFSLHEGNHKITWGLDGARKKTVGVATNTRTEHDESATVLQKMMTLDKLSSKVVYENILDGVDLEYVINSCDVKENIIVKEKSDNYSYSFTISLNNLDAVLTSDGSVEFLDVKTHDIVYNIPAGYMYDANQEYSTSVTYKLNRIGNGKYVLTVVADKDWINDEERVFPICIDPTISIEYSNTFDATFISTSERDVPNPYDFLCAGKYAIAYWRTKSLPELPEDVYVQKATFVASGISLIGWWPVNLGTYKVMNEWDSATFCYNQYIAGEAGQIYDRPTDAQTPTFLSMDVKWDITKCVRDWYNDPDRNFGIAIKFTGEQFTGGELNIGYRFEPGNDGSPLCIYYKRMIGTENYWSYSKQSAGVAGTGYVNNASGNLTFSIGTLKTTDKLYGMPVSLIYNQTFSGEYYTESCAAVPYRTGMVGYGFKLNLDETIVQRQYYNEYNELITYYIWVDGDGTEHRFSPKKNKNGSYISNAAVYEDEDGLLLTMEVHDDSYTISDMNHNVRTFEKIESDTQYLLSGGILTYISDKNGNKVHIVHDERGRITSLEIIPSGSSAIEFFAFTYNAAGILKSIFNSSADQKVNFYYSEEYNGVSFSTESGAYLRQVEFLNKGESIARASYEYDSSGRMISAYNHLSDYRVEYTYKGQKIVQVVEKAGSEETEGQKITFDYRIDYTEIRSSGSDDIYGTDDDIITSYIFDTYGRVTCYYSSDLGRTQIYGAVSGEYETQENVKNNVKVSTAIGGVASNYLLNGGFEKAQSGIPIGWYKKANVSIVDTEVLTHGQKSAKFTFVDNTTSELYQYVNLPKGRYTLSAEIDTFCAENVSAQMIVESLSAPSRKFVEDIPINENHAAKRPQTISLNFEAFDADLDGNEKFKVTIRVTSATSADTNGYLTVDNVMLEKNIGHSGYSMVEYGNFENYAISSTGSVQYPYTNFWNHADVVYMDEAFGNVLKIEGNKIYYTERANQAIYSAKESDLIEFEKTFSCSDAPRTFIVSGMAKGEQPTATSSFCIGVYIYYAIKKETEEGTYKRGRKLETVYLDFQNDSTEWQYVSGSFVTEPNMLIEGIIITCEYTGLGVAYFDNIYVTEVIDQSTVSNEYYDNGQVHVKKNGIYTECYEYDDNHNLIRMANDNGELYEYTYTETNDIKSKVYYTFVNIDGSLNYPYIYVNPDEYIVKTPVLKTDYTYNRYGLLLSTKAYEVEYRDSEIVKKTGTKYVTSSSYYKTDSGSKIFGAVISELDNLGINTRYYYNAYNGNLLATVNTSQGTGVSYTYDLFGNVTSVTPVTYQVSSGYTPVTNQQKVEYEYNSANRLESITTDSTQYIFSYDSFGKNEAIQIGDREIVGYEYHSNNGKISKINYGNGFSAEYIYNELDNIKELWYNDNGVRTIAFEYQYSADGLLTRVDNHLTEKSVLYKYDKNKRLTGCVEISTEEAINLFSYGITYDDKSLVEKFSYSFDYNSGTSVKNAETTYKYSYRADDSLSGVSIDAKNVSGQISFEYDSYQRLYTQTNEFYMYSSSTPDFTNRINYTYRSNGANTSSLIETYTTQINTRGALTYTYTYDYNGNITKIKLSNGAEYRYVYDDMGQLLREDNTTTGKTYVYTYDNAGNILTKKIYALTSAGATPTTLYNSYSYGYGDEDWGDLLTSLNGINLTYDEIGNPLTYYNGSNYTFTWKNGRQLATAKRGAYTLSFAYNEKGLRTAKTVNGVVHTFYLYDSMVIAEEWENNLCVYLYDAEGAPIGMQYRSSDMSENLFITFLYEKNVQGDIVAVYNDNGNKLISYVYDAWGNVATTVHSSDGLNLYAKYNPFRYRGYYYDKETGFYYLNSRYYDPKTGRFINLDNISIISATPDELTDKNLFAYCDNNPIIRIDEDGEFWNFVIGAVGGALIGGGVQIVSNLISGKDWSDGLGVAMVTGAASGLLAASGVGLVGSIAGNAAISMAGNAANQIIRNNGVNDFDIGDMIADGVIGGIAGAVGGSGMGKSANIQTLNKNLTKKVFSGSTQAAKQGAKYYLSQTKSLYKNFLIKPLLNSGVASATSFATKELLWRWYESVF